VRDYGRPMVIVSKCLGFDRCRYNGATIPDRFVELLKPLVEFRPVCPEMEIGLGVPREPVRVVQERGARRLIQPATGRDLTAEMVAFSGRFLASLGQADGFILKSRSPSCGLKDVKIYAPEAKSGPLGAGQGFFGQAVLEAFPRLPVEDEGRLSNYPLREHFLKRLFLWADFRRISQAGRLGGLVEFHSGHKFTLMAYNQKEMRLLGRIAANPERRPANEVFEDYAAHLVQALARTPPYTANINVLMHGLGHFSERLSRDEKAFFLDALDKYRRGKLPLSGPTLVLLGLVARFGDEYLRRQSFFEPYPEELMDLTDSGKGRIR